MKDNSHEDYYLKLRPANYGELQITLEMLLDSSGVQSSEGHAFGRFELAIPPNYDGVGRLNAVVKFVPLSKESNSKESCHYATNKEAYDMALECIASNSLIVEPATPKDLSIILGTDY